MTRTELERKMAVLLGGRSAEHVVFGEISTGAADDLMRVTDIARVMFLRYGMSDVLGNVAYDRDSAPFLQSPFPARKERNHSEETAHAVDGEVHTLVESAYVRANAILERNRGLLDRAAVALLETQTLIEAEIELLKGEIVGEQPASARAALAA
jgi:cell division protease FtsH